MKPGGFGLGSTWKPSGRSVIPSTASIVSGMSPGAQWAIRAPAYSESRLPGLWTAPQASESRHSPGSTKEKKAATAMVAAFSKSRSGGGDRPDAAAVSCGDQVGPAGIQGQLVHHHV